MKFFFIFIPIFFISQSYRVIYDYSYVTDTIAKNKFSTRYYLDIYPQKVKFYNENFYISDSIQKQTKENSSMTMSGSLMCTRVTGSNENTVYKFIDSDYYKIKSSDKQRWKIESESKKVNEYNLQLATTQFGGRIWKAWFCKDINFAEGPYKFRGLPGLIFEIEDDKGYFKFKLSEIKKLMYEYDTKNFLESNFGKKALPVTVEVFNKLLINAYNNPFSEIRTKMMMGEDYTLAIYGRQVKNVNDLDDIKRLRQEEIRKNYNPIELSTKVYYK